MDFFRNPYASWLPSPNFWPDRNGHSPEWLGPGVDASWFMFHVTDCTAAAAEATFESQVAQRSAHYLITIDAQLVKDAAAPFGFRPSGIIQLVDEGDAAWHSGNGDMNENSIGAEHERTQAMIDGHTIFPPGQLLASMWLAADCARRHKRPLDRTYNVGHRESNGAIGPIYGLGRGSTSTACPDDFPVDLVVKGAALLAAGGDPRTLFAPKAVSGPATDRVDGVSIPGVVYQGGTIYGLSVLTDGSALLTDNGHPCGVGTALTYTAAVKVAGKWYDEVGGAGGNAYIADDDLDTSDPAHPNGSTPADYRPAPPAPEPAPRPVDPVPPPAPPPAPAPAPAPGGPPVENPPVVDTPDVPEPAPVAEAGVSTSEWKVLIAYAAQLAAVETSSVAAQLNLTIPPAVLNAIVAGEFLLGAAAVSYIVGRSIRKIGTRA